MSSTDLPEEQIMAFVAKWAPLFEAGAPVGNFDLSTVLTDDVCMSTEAHDGVKVLRPDLDLTTVCGLDKVEELISKYDRDDSDAVSGLKVVGNKLSMTECARGPDMPGGISDTVTLTLVEANGQLKASK